MIWTLFAIAAQASSPSPSPVAPPPRTAQVSLVTFAPGTVRCGATPTPAVLAPVPNAAQAWVAEPNFPPIVLRFAIDASGRPISIAQPERQRGPYLDTSDLAPTLAAWRFAPGAVRTGCAIAFIPGTYAVSAAPIAIVHRAFALPHVNGPAEGEMRKRLTAEAVQCFTPRPPAVRSRAFPDFAEIPQPPGTASYAMVGFDIDASGRPVRAHILSSDGNRALDAAAIRAIGASRFGPGARTGCSYPYHRRQSQPMAAPIPPDADSYRKAGARCDAGAPWALPPRMTYPEAFRRRAIEGWAVIGYDVAPWGATGNVTVLASEPAAAFGEAARSIVEQAKRPPSDTGATGCVDRVLFKLSEGDAMAPQEPVPPPPF